MNNNSYNLAFTKAFGCQKVTFLALKIEVTNEGVLRSNIYRKPTAGNTILQANSFHLAPLIHSISHPQYFPLWRNCCEDAQFKIAANELLPFGERILQVLHLQGLQQSCTTITITAIFCN